MPLPQPIDEAIDDLLKTGLLDNWYMVSRDEDIGTKPVGLTRLSKNIVLWRDATGQVRCLEDICPHRGARLSLGHVCQGEIACAYHGVQLDGAGIVTQTPSTPGSQLIGQKLVTSYPVREANGGIWVYFSNLPLQGEPPALRFPDEFENGEWSGFLDIRDFDCNYQLVRDNQFDPVHGSYLHTGTHILSAGRKDAELAYEKTDQGFIVWRTNQQGVNLDKTWLIRLANSGFWAVTDLPYPKKEGGGMGRLFRFPTPIDREHTLVWNYRMQKLDGWRHDAWRFLYRNRGSERGAQVLEQDRVALAGLPKSGCLHENLLQCDIGVARIRRLYREEAERQIKARQVLAPAAE